MLQNTDLDFTDKGIVAPNVLLGNESELSQLFKMMLRHAWTAEVQELLNFPNAHRTTVLQQKPIDCPIFTPECIFKLCFSIRVQQTSPLLQYIIVVVPYNSKF